MPTGRVKWFSLEKGFGFISNDEGEDVYLAAAALPEGVATVKPGTKLEFSIADGRRGPQALSVSIVEAPPTMATNSRGKNDDLAAIEDAGKSEYVGEFYSIDTDEERIATYLFQAKLPGYVGWMWAVSVAKIDDQSEATICDVVLLPGNKALLAPNWVPYSQRIQPGDLGIGDVVPTEADDERLTQTYAALPGEEELDNMQIFEFGLTRARVISIVGRDMASKRWYDGDRGPLRQLLRQLLSLVHHVVSLFQSPAH